MTTNPTDEKLALINEIISMYHTTRLRDTPAAVHILSKPSVQKAFAAMRNEALEDAADAPQDGGEKLAAIRQREIQMIGAAISRRSWHDVEVAYNQLRDKVDAILIARALQQKDPS